ncbi:hypothetical protein JTE90_021779 [Oedothorax gibbosus]|uniref:Transmembrane protein 107 n=1 Tax=Oedothorax gibbosus TaxID=931172 RepID=A0AAV6UQQ4_9ARAC|nr:hypothetical protein JTE90_021779 [Oedothorax gibbosus]
MIQLFKRETLAKNNLPLYLEMKDGELQAQHLRQDLDQRINKFTLIFSTSIALVTAELLSFVGGISMLITWQNQISTFCHFISVCFLLFLLYYKWSEEMFYGAFILSIVPAVTEVFPIVNLLLRKF